MKKQQSKRARSIKKRIEMIKYLYENKPANRYKDRKTPYFNGTRLYLYMDRSCFSVEVLRSYKGKDGKILYQIDCGAYDGELILQNVPERFLGKTAVKPKNREVMTHEFFTTLTERR